jgi:hypothetical protein
MTRLGRNVKITLGESRRATFRAAITALGCDVVSPNAEMDVYRFADGSMLGAQIVADDQALPEDLLEKAPWLELAVDDVPLATAKLDSLGLSRVEYHDNGHAYFRAPGGVVFRLAALRPTA